MIIKKTIGYSNPKSLFPDNWTNTDIVDAIKQASLSNHSKNEFFDFVTKRGVTLKVRGFFIEDGGIVTSLISHGFPDIK